MTEQAFEVGMLARLRDAKEVDIETRSPAGATHRATIWVVVDASDRVLIRSWRGASARWYRDAVAAGIAALVFDGRTLPVRVERAADPARIDTCSQELLVKYAGDPAARSMVRDEVLDTTLELHPGW